MNPTFQTLKRHYHNFKRHEYTASINGLLVARKTFVTNYPLTSIKGLKLTEYCIGEESDNFCYDIERRLDHLGRIRGSRAPKFGVYKSLKTNDYKFVKRFGNTLDVSFKNIKNAIYELISAGQREDIKSLINNPISTMYKGKILNCYFPNRFLNIYSDDLLSYYINQLSLLLPNQISDLDAVEKREVILKFKNADTEMTQWSIYEFANFLHYHYPLLPIKVDEKEQLEIDEFPPEQSAQFIDLSLDDAEANTRKGSRIKGNSNLDYEGKQRRQKRIGDRGEKLVIELEQLRLKDFPKLQSKVKKAKYDYMGYDIESREFNGDKRFIEVKTTTRKVGATEVFISSNEIDTAEKLKETYHLYVVYDIKSINPKVWNAGNPFNPESKKLTIKPINFSVKFNVDK